MNTDNHTHQGFKNRLEKHPHAHYIKKTMPWLGNVAEVHKPYLSKALRNYHKPFSITTGEFVSRKQIGSKKIKRLRPIGSLALFLFLRFGSRAVPELRHLIPREN